MTQKEPPTDKPDSQGQSIGAIFSRLGPAAYLGIAWAVMPAIAGFLLLANMNKASDILLQRNDDGGGSLAIGVAMYVGIFFISAGLGFLPTYSQAILAGYVFGIGIGFPAALLGFTGASIIGYYIARRVARKSVESELHIHPKATIVRDAFVRHGYWRAMGILILLRISPASPFSIMNGLMAVSGVKLLPYVLATAIGMAPRTFVAVFIGREFGLDKGDRPIWIPIVGVVILFIVIMALAKMAEHAIEEKMGTKSQEPESPATD